MAGYKSKKMLTDRQPQATDDEQDDLTLVYMWAFKKGEESAKARIEELEAALKPFAKYASIDPHDGEWVEHPPHCWDGELIAAAIALGKK